jgi:L-ascorbate metabolism protein UlaG (beta-lactamase superfamily)
MKKLFYLTVISFIFSLLTSEKGKAQERLDYWGDGETYLQDQASLTFDMAYQLLAAYPPGINMGVERRFALLALDGLLHDTRLDNGVAFKSYLNKMAGNIVAELQKPKPSGNEIRFYRFYNHGFIVQTPTVTVGIDLIRSIGAEKSFISDTLMRTIVEQCDILFITHAHGDHTDISVMKMFCEQGKDVIVPEEKWADLDPHLRVVRGSEMVSETIRLPAKNTWLTVRVYPGRQGNMLNNVYMITLPEGQTIMHTGDQDFSEDLIANVGSSIKVDVLLVQCWMMPMKPFVSGINPALIICGHENEVGHTIDHREAYWLTFRRMADVKIPYVVMAWGESFTTPAPPKAKKY